MPITHIVLFFVKIQELRTHSKAFMCNRLIFIFTFPFPILILIPTLFPSFVPLRFPFTKNLSTSLT